MDNVISRDEEVPGQLHADSLLPSPFAGRKEHNSFLFRDSGCQIHEQVLFRMTAFFYFKIPFYSLNSGVWGYAPKTSVPFGILNMQPNEKSIKSFTVKLHM